MNEQVNYAKIQRIQDDLDNLVIGQFGTGFCTDAMLYESGIKATVASHTSQLADMANNQKISSYTYGTFDTAGVVGVIANESEPKIQVLGLTSTQQASSYADRDSVSLYISNKSTTPTLTISSGTITYGNTSVTIPSGYDLSKIKQGMLIDTLHTPNRYTSIVDSIDYINNIINVKDGWYLVQTGGSSTPDIPTGNIGFMVNMTTKVWGINNVVTLNDADTTKHAIAEEIDLFGRKTDNNNNSIGGIDIVNFGSQAPRFGFSIRKTGTSSSKVLEGYISRDTNKSFVNRTNTPDSDILVYSSADDGQLSGAFNDKDNYKVYSNGKVNKIRTFTQIITTTSQTINTQTSCTIFNIPSDTDTYNIITPANVGDGSLRFFKNISSNYIYLAGSNFYDCNNTIRTTYFLRSGNSVTLISDGTNWHVLTDNNVVDKCGNTASRPTRCLNGQTYFDTQILKNITYFNGNWYSDGVSV